MDVHCSSCREPWDTCHLLCDAVFDTDLTENELESWQELPACEQLSARYREAFRVADWEFGASLLHVRRCPCCPEATRPDPDAEAKKIAIVELLGDDHDAVAGTFEDYGL